MRRISSDIEAKVIEMWFEGYTREYVAKTLGIGEATVSDIIKTLPSCLQIARDIAVENRKHNLTLADAWKGLEMAVQLAAAGVTKPEQIQSFIQTAKKMSTDAGYEPSRVISAAIELSNLEAQSGKKYPEAKEEFETAIKKKSELDKEKEERKKENLQLQLEIERSKQLRRQTLEQAKTAPQELAEFLNCKAALREHGMNIKDAKSVRKTLGNIREIGGGRMAKRLVSLIKNHDSLMKSVAYLERQLQADKDELANLLPQITESRQVISELQEEKTRLQAFINSQTSAINVNDYRLYLIQANIAELEKRRQGLITWIGKEAKMSPEQIEILRQDTEYKIMLAIVDNKLLDILKFRYGAQ